MKLVDDNLNYDDKTCCKENELCKTKCDDYYVIFYDFETITEGDIHVPYLMCGLTEDNKKIFHYGPNCGKKFLKDIAKLGKKNILLVAHNSRYDYTFIMDYLYANNPCLKGNRLMTGSANIYTKNGQKINLKFQDTLNFLVCPLSKFPSMFNLESIKEVIPYQLYTEENVKQRYLDINYCLEILKDEKLSIAHGQGFGRLLAFQP